MLNIWQIGAGTVLVIACGYGLYFVASLLWLALRALIDRMIPAGHETSDGFFYGPEPRHHASSDNAEWLGIGGESFVHAQHDTQNEDA